MSVCTISAICSSKGKIDVFSKKNSSKPRSYADFIFVKTDITNYFALFLPNSLRALCKQEKKQRTSLTNDLSKTHHSLHIPKGEHHFVRYQSR